MERGTVHVGDWVCFTLCQQPVYAKVEYILSLNCSPLGDKLVTTAGEVYEDSILEVRRAQ